MYANPANWQIGNTSAPGTAVVESTQAAMWCRGLLLKARLSIPSPLQSYNTSQHSDIEHFQAEGLVTSDGSGLRGSSSLLRRCGFSAVLPRHDQAAEEWLSIALPLIGHQTVPRAELSAVLTVAQAMVSAVVLWTDHKPIVDAFEQGLASYNPAANQDLWQDLIETLQKKRLSFEVHWVPAHAVTFADLKPDIPKIVYHGNKEADTKAKEAAAMHPIGPGQHRQGHRRRRTLQGGPEAHSRHCRGLCGGNAAATQTETSPARRKAIHAGADSRCSCDDRTPALPRPRWWAGDLHSMHCQGTLCQELPVAMVGWRVR